jgi:hypothetical protein
VALLLRNDRLQSDGGVAVPSSTIMEDDVNFLHWGDCATKKSELREHAPCHVDK